MIRFKSISRANRLRMALPFYILLMAVSTLIPAQAQSFQSWLKQPTLTGDWGGVRTSLNDIGISPFGTYVGEYADGASGGKEQGEDYAQQFQFGVETDLGKLVGLQGSSLRVVINSRSGRSTSADYIGNKLEVQEIYGAGQNFRLTEVSFDQKLDDNIIDFKFGFSPMGNDFARTLLLCDFMNVGFCSHPQTLAPSSGWTNFPTGHWGARLALDFTPSFYAETAVFDVNPVYSEVGHDPDMSLAGSTGVIVPVEFGVTTHLGAAKMPGHYKVGGYYDTSTVPNAANPMEKDSGRYGGYILVDQMVYSFTGGHTRGVILFGQASVADARTATLQNLWNCGVIVVGLANVRPADYFDLGFVHAGINQRVIDEKQVKLAITDPADVPLDMGEGVLEFGYGIQFTPWLQVRPNIQYVIDPGAFSYKNATPNAWVFGLQTKGIF